MGLSLGRRGALLLNPRGEKAFFSRQRSKQRQGRRHEINDTVGAGKEVGMAAHRAWEGLARAGEGEMGRHLVRRSFKCHDDFFPLVQEF